MATESCPGRVCVTVCEGKCSKGGVQCVRVVREKCACACSEGGGVQYVCVVREKCALCM